MFYNDKKRLTLSVLALSVVGIVPGIGVFFNDQQSNTVLGNAVQTLALTQNSNNDSACSTHFEAGYKKNLLEAVDNGDEYFISGCGGSF